MISNEFILQDRIQKIRQIINKYGEENFYLSFSGGKDSTVLSHLIDMALPENKIPRVYANTGIEYRLILEFVEREKEHPWELIILKPKVPYKPPYNFTRTGCKGCPFAIELQQELDTLEKFFPEERKQCEFIWKPVYEEYRRLNYRLKKNCQLSFEDSWRWTDEDEEQ